MGNPKHHDFLPQENQAAFTSCFYGRPSEIVGYKAALEGGNQAEDLLIQI